MNVESQLTSEEKHLEVTSNDKVSGMKKSNSLDDVTDFVACNC